VDTKNVDNLVRFIVLTAGQADDFNDRRIGPIHIIKYLYLADLAFASRNGGKTFTGLDWRFHHFGPWDVAAYQRLEPALSITGIERFTFESQFDDKENVRWVGRDDELFQKAENALPYPVTAAVRRAFREFGTDTCQLLHHVYRTAPMVHAAPEERLDFSYAVPDEESELKAESIPDQAESLSVKKMKAQKQRMNNLKERVKAKLAEKRASSRMVAPTPPPRYDEIFAQGIEWLDTLAGAPVPECVGEVEFDESLWNHPARTESDVP
jgi:hypothetical protein